MRDSEKRRIFETFLVFHRIDFTPGARLSHLARRIRAQFPDITEPCWPAPRRWARGAVESLANHMIDMDPSDYKPNGSREFYPLAPQKNLKSGKHKSFYYSKPWRKLRYSVLIERGRKCECCGELPSDKRKVHVDHIKPISKYPHLRFDKENLQILCSECNYGRGNSDQTDWRKDNNTPISRENRDRAIEKNVTLPYNGY